MYQMAKEMINVVKKELNLNVSLIELAYITMKLVSSREIWFKKIL
ncbi:PRD domain-containing protein [Clostridium chromiireducens]